MSEQETVNTGHCLCGAVRYRVEGELRDVLACHCTQCQRASGSFFMATNAPVDRVEIDDSQASLRWFRDPDGPWAERGFCAQCGSNLFWRQDGSGTLSITAGTMDTPHPLKLGAHIFVDDKGSHYAIGDDLPQYPASSAGMVPDTD